jgi:hypothetical protein
LLSRNFPPSLDGPAVLAGDIAERKGRSLAAYPVAGLIVGPLVLLIAFVVPRRSRIVSWISDAASVP